MSADPVDLFNTYDPQISTNMCAEELLIQLADKAWFMSSRDAYLKVAPQVPGSFG